LLTFPEPVTEYTFKPQCKSFGRKGEKARDDHHSNTITVMGVERYYCAYIPPGTTTTHKRPLLIWLHGAGTTADSMYDVTSLRLKAEDYPLSVNSELKGFYLISVQGRHLHWPTEPPRSGPNYDFYYRDLRSPSTNPDIAFFDALIDQTVETGLVDTRQIYMMGWSAGGHFTTFYGIIRHEQRTPGGNRIAAVVSYSSGDPFEDPIPNLTPSCHLKNYPQSNVPILLISHDCDIIVCDIQQEMKIASNGKDFWGYPPYPMFDMAGIYVGPGDVVAQWIADLRDRVGNRRVKWLLVNAIGDEVSSCSPMCTAGDALGAHCTWPNGDSYAVQHMVQGRDLEVNMLDYLKQYPLIS